MKKLYSKMQEIKDVKIDDMKNEMENLIERWFELHRGDVSYGELVELAKENIEKRMGELVTGGDVLWTWDINTELEDMIPDPIQWR